jgi:hypothetical protein
MSKVLLRYRYDGKGSPTSDQHSRESRRVLVKRYWINPNTVWPSGRNAPRSPIACPALNP